MKSIVDGIRKEVTELHCFLKFCGNVLFKTTQGVSFSNVVDQMYHVGVRSVSTVVWTGLFVGAIMAVQINSELKDFGAQNFLGGLSTSVTLRNIGPVLIAFLLSGKVGAYTSAELATMRVTDQIEAIRCLGGDPIKLLVSPRLVAVVVSSFLLLNVGVAVSLVGGIAIAQWKLGVNAANYVGNIPQLVTAWSVGTGVVKSFFFGFVLALISCYRGYTATGGAEGVGTTVKRTTVEVVVSIIVLNYFLSCLSQALHEMYQKGLGG